MAVHDAFHGEPTKIMCESVFAIPFSLELLNLIVRRHNLWSEGGETQDRKVGFFPPSTSKTFP